MRTKTQTHVSKHDGCFFKLTVEGVCKRRTILWTIEGFHFAAHPVIQAGSFNPVNSKRYKALGLNSLEPVLLSLKFKKLKQ
jgi:hypothetical protein